MQNEHMDDAAKVDRVARNDIARRDLLWLRAHEKRDDQCIESLERADPLLRKRMTSFVAEHLVTHTTNHRLRRHLFGELWSRRYDEA